MARRKWNSRPRALVRELLGPDATEDQVHYCETSIISLLRSSHGDAADSHCLRRLEQEMDAQKKEPE